MGERGASQHGICLTAHPIEDFGGLPPSPSGNPSLRAALIGLAEGMVVRIWLIFECYEMHPAASHQQTPSPGFVPRPSGNGTCWPTTPPESSRTTRRWLPWPGQPPSPIPGQGSKSGRAEMATGRTRGCTAQRVGRKRSMASLRQQNTLLISPGRRHIKRQMIVAHDRLRPVINGPLRHSRPLTHFIHRPPAVHDELQQLPWVDLHL